MVLGQVHGRFHGLRLQAARPGFTAVRRMADRGGAEAVERFSDGGASIRLT
jgi:hypothetical protein